VLNQKIHFNPAKIDHKDVAAINSDSNRFTNRQLFGKRQEKHAARFLCQRGLKLLKTNYQCKLGEIDLVMLDTQQQLIFVEVRYRSQNNFGSAIESITVGKQKKIRLTAMHFLLAHPQFDHLVCRFDVIGLTRSSERHLPDIEWIKNAFH